MAKIVVVEDMEPIRTALVVALQKRGHIVFPASNGKEGLQLILNKHPDLALIDIVMPEMSGEELVKQLRADAWGKELPIMVLTNIGDSDQIDALQELGVYDYMIKSNWELERVVENIERKLSAVVSNMEKPA
jgi:CheY-like chemotaxis protein